MVRKWTSALSLRVSPRPAYADLGQFDDAGRCISEAMAAIEKTKDEVNRIADEIALMRPKPRCGEGSVFERALAVARQQVSGE
jgi:hypothetical protein